MFTKQMMKRMMITVSTIILVAIMASPVWAGNGDGSGGGKNDALQLVASTPTDGQKDVHLPVTINLSFNKNVVNMAVKDQNQKQISLDTEDNQPVKIQVHMPDDQVDFAKRKEVTVIPQEDLQPNTTYVLKIAPQFQAKNGSTLERAVSIKFITAGGAAVAQSAAKPASSGGQLSLVIILVLVVLALLIVVGYMKRKRK